jgi:hypothetical protein
VVFGMSIATMTGIFIIPVFYVLVQSFEERIRGTPAVASAAQS